MHQSSLLKAEFFVKHYASRLAREDRLATVLEIGSKSYYEQDTYRPAFDPQQFDYTGLDTEAGPNVDIVPKNGFVWQEIDNETFDVCISGQTFEHNPFFWVTFAEIARVLTPGGYALIVAPGAGEVHRFPFDCYRFYPDAWLGLCTLTGLELIESYFESDESALVAPGGSWRDCALIARKPTMDDAEAAGFYANLDAIVRPLGDLPFQIGTPIDYDGPCFAEYETYVQKTYPLRPIKELRRRINRKSSARLLAGKSLHRG